MHGLTHEELPAYPRTAQDPGRVAEDRPVTFQNVVPPGVSVVGGAVHSLQGPLWPEEEGGTGRMGDKRRREFVAGRTCARRALRQLGRGDAPVLAGPRRQPLWPAGVVGSITHTDTYCAAAVAWQRDITALGIDAETRTALGRDLEPLVCRDAELRWCHHAEENSGLAAKLLFSIKESIFKAAFPLTGKGLGFLDVEVTIHVDTRRFAVVDAGPSAGEGRLLEMLEGRFELFGDHLVTAAWLSGQGLVTC